MEQIFFNVKQWYFLTLKKICSIEIFEKIELELLESWTVQTFKNIHRRKRKIFAFNLGIFTHVTSIFWPIVN